MVYLFFSYGSDLEIGMVEHWTQIFTHVQSPDIHYPLKILVLHVLAAAGQKGQLVKSFETRSSA
jgi:hypothetical protein